MVADRVRKLQIPLRSEVFRVVDGGTFAVRAFSLRRVGMRARWRGMAMRNWLLGLGAAALCMSATAQAQVKPRIVIAFDTSGSMALDLSGVPTFGDGVLTGCTQRAGGEWCGTNCTAGIDSDCDGLANDSRIFVAKEALRNMVLAFGDVEFALARFSRRTLVQSPRLRRLRIASRRWNATCWSVGLGVDEYLACSRQRPRSSLSTLFGNSSD